MSILNDHQTICALATASGGAIGIIRVSGSDAITIVDKIFVSTSGKSLENVAARSVLYGHVTNENGTTIDETLITIFRAPHSYTGENSVEISCHGCRQAFPGEFTQRAFLNGKMDLSQAEAVADLIASTNKATHQLAMGQLRGYFSNELNELREKLLKITSLIELELDFSDQDVTFAERSELLQLALSISDKITLLTQSFEVGNAIKSGISVAIIGKTNVGKSTLLNKLLKENRAIVSEIHGTTRDVIEDTIQISGINFRFIDTAGIRQTHDEIENLGIERTYQKLSTATIVLWVIDMQPTPDEISEIEEKVKGKKLIIVINKIDRNQFTLPIDTWAISPTVILISAKYNTNIPQLESAIYQAANLPEIRENDVIITNIRHYNALTHAQEGINRVIEGIHLNLSGDLLSEDLRECLHHLSEITGGAITSNEVLGTIFSHFCIGK